MTTQEQVQRRSPLVSTQGAYRVEDGAGRVVARYITNYAGELVWSVVHEGCFDDPSVTIADVLEAADRGDMLAVRVVA